MNRKLLLGVCAVGVLSFHCGSMSTNNAGTGGGSGGGRVDAGTGGGAGGTGGGGGTSAACTPAPAFVPTDINGKAGFDPGGTPSPPPFNFATMARPSATTGRFDVMFNEFYGMAPISGALPATNYQQCSACMVIQTGCDSMGANCAKIYLAQSGTISVTAATKSPDAGSYAFTLTDVTYQAWDFNADVATDAGCLTLPSFAFSGVWP
jgi:hypothetical protein